MSAVVRADTDELQRIKVRRRGMRAGGGGLGGRGSAWVF